MEQTEHIPVRTLFAGTIQILDRLIKQSPKERRVELRRARETLRASLNDAEKTQPVVPNPEATPLLQLAAGIVEPESKPPSNDPPILNNPPPPPAPPPGRHGMRNAVGWGGNRCLHEAFKCRRMLGLFP